MTFVYNKHDLRITYPWLVARITAGSMPFWAPNSVQCAAVSREVTNDTDYSSSRGNKLLSTKNMGYVQFHQDQIAPLNILWATFQL